MTTSNPNRRKSKAVPAVSASPAVSRAAIVRTVASSTAIETGERIASLERILLAQTSKYRDLKLAR